MRSSRASTLDTLAQLRHGVVLGKDVVAAGFDADLPAREVKAGRWRRLHPGVYFTAAVTPDLRAKCHAALLHAGPLAAITGTAGCALRGLADPPADAEVTVLVPHTVRVVHSGLCHVLRTRSMPPTQVLQVEGRVDLAVAHLDRCLVDGIRRETDLAAARALATRVIRDDHLHWDSVLKLAARPVPDMSLLRRVVRDVEDGIRSPAEGDLHDHLLPAARKGDLPPYLLNPSMFLDGELLASPDAFFPGLGLGDEMDSRTHHGSAEDLDATLLRHERVARSGLHLNHTTPKRFAASPAAHVAKLIGLVAERRALPVPEPSGLVVLGRGPLLPARTPWPQVQDRLRF